MELNGIKTDFKFPHSHRPPDFQQCEKNLNPIDDTALGPLSREHILQQLLHTLLPADTMEYIVISTSLNRVCLHVVAHMSDLRLQHRQQRVRLWSILELIGLVSAQTNDVAQSLRRIGLPLWERKTHVSIQSRGLSIHGSLTDSESMFYTSSSLSGWNKLYKSLGQLLCIQPLLRTNAHIINAQNISV